MEIKAGWLAVRDHVQTGSHLVVNGWCHRIFNHRIHTGRSKLIQVFSGKFKPPGEGP